MDKTKFWNTQHQTHDKYWLTGSLPAQVIFKHGVDEEFAKSNTFLDIGVGFGAMSKYAKLKRKHVLACDISSLALIRLQGIAAKTSTNVAELPPADLAIAHLVFQHCDNETIKQMINNVKLTSGGVFSFQFACFIPNQEPNARVKELISLGSHYFRSLDDMQIIISQTNKEIVTISEPIDFTRDENLRWYYVKTRERNL